MHRFLGAVLSQVGILGVLVPVMALLILLVREGIIKNEKLAAALQKWIVPLCWVMAAVTVLDLVNIRRRFAVMGIAGDFYALVSHGFLLSILIPIASAILYIVVAGMVKKQPKEIAKGYRFGFYGVFLVFVFLGVLSLIGGANTLGILLDLLGIWFLPLAFVNANNADAVIKEGIIAVVAIAAIMLISYMVSNAGGRPSASYSNIVPEDLQKMGVSEKEYLEIYNYFKYGVNFGN